MAYGSWLKEMESQDRSFARTEKIAVYGTDVYCQAIKNIIECDNDYMCGFDLPAECRPFTWSVILDAGMYIIPYIFIVIYFSGFVAALFIS